MPNTHPVFLMPCSVMPFLALAELAVFVNAAMPAALWGGRIGSPTGVVDMATRHSPLKSVEDVNAQFRNDGVFIHQFDATQDYSKPWMVDLSRSTFTSVSLTSAAFPYFYSTSLGGMLFSSEFVINETHTPVRCACTCDCNSMGRGPTGCSKVSELAGSLPADTGCSNAHKDTLATAYRTVDDMLVRLNPQANSRCIWTPTMPYDNNTHNIDPQGRVRPPPGETMIGHFECKYNEIVLGAAEVNQAMPAMLDAIFFTQNCWRDPRAHLLTLPTNKSQALAVYEQFLAAYPSAPAPLFLALDCARLDSGQGASPFVEANISVSED